ncbi:hypothetical protein D3C81_1413710 [compost metagenome]
MTRRCRTRQLIRHQVVHALQLHAHFLAQLLVTAGTAVQLRAQHRQRRLQTVGEIGQRVALTLQILALAFDEGVDAFGQRLQFTRMHFTHALTLAALNFCQLVDHALEWAQAPLQHQSLQQQQDQAGHTQPEPHRTLEPTQLFAQRA